jgi:hypothetical protein
LSSAKLAAIPLHDFPINTSIEVVPNAKVASLIKGEEEDIARRAHVGTRLHDDD